MALFLVIGHALLRRPLQHFLQQQLPQLKTKIGSAATVYTLEKLGKREIVGYGANGQYGYQDRLDFPMPAIRFREPDEKICAIREKERCDWKKMNIEEKKALYRYSFCQTFAEMKAPTGEWKIPIGVGFWACTLGYIYVLVCNTYLCPPYPDTFEPERRRAQLKRMLDLEFNMVEGIAHFWDYDNDKWK